jgi:hypothetical protein
MWKACDLHICPQLGASEDAQVRYMEHPSNRHKILDSILLARLKNEGERGLASWFNKRLDK